MGVVERLVRRHGGLRQPARAAPRCTIMPAVTHVLETSLYVADLDAAEMFYRELFDFPVFLRDDRMAALGVPGQSVLLLFRVGGSLTPTVTPLGIIPAHGGEGQQHLCFAIADAALPEWEQTLESSGLPVESRVAWDSGSVSLYFRDPDGHSVELATPRLWPNYGR